MPAGWTAVTRGWRRRANSFPGGIVGKASRRHHERRPGPREGGGSTGPSGPMPGSSACGDLGEESAPARRPPGGHRGPRQHRRYGAPKGAGAARHPAADDHPPPPYGIAPIGAPSPPSRRGKPRQNPGGKPRGDGGALERVIGDLSRSDNSLLPPSGGRRSRQGDEGCAARRRGSRDLGARGFRSCGAALTRPSGTLSHPAGGRGEMLPPQHATRHSDVLLLTAKCSMPPVPP